MYHYHENHGFKQMGLVAGLATTEGEISEAKHYANKDELISAIKIY